MDRRKLFSFLPAVPLSAGMAAAALAKEKTPIGDGHLWLKINNEWKRIVTE